MNEEAAERDKYIVVCARGYVLETQGEFFWTGAPNQATQYSKVAANIVAETIGDACVEVIPADASSGVAQD